MWQRVHILCTHRAYKNWSEKKTKKPSIGINDKRLKSKCNIIKFQTSLINKMSFKLKKSGLNISNNIKSQNLSSLTRDQTAALAVKVQNPSNWNARNPHISILKCKKKVVHPYQQFERINNWCTHHSEWIPRELSFVNKTINPESLH